MTAPTLIELFEELRALHTLIEQRDLPLIVPRHLAAKQLGISPRQLRRLIAARRISAQPSGIARTEFERYAQTPQEPLPRVQSRSTALRTATDEAARLDARLKALRRPKGARR